MRNYKISRRNFLAVAGTLTAAAALTACGGSASSTVPAQLLPAWQAIALPLPHPAPAK